MQDHAHDHQLIGMSIDGYVILLGVSIAAHGLVESTCDDDHRIKRQLMCNTILLVMLVHGAGVRGDDGTPHVWPL